MAVMILIATIILHGIAINRGSGNLASSELRLLIYGLGCMR